MQTHSLPARWVCRPRTPRQAGQAPHPTSYFVLSNGKMALGPGGQAGNVPFSSISVPARSCGLFLEKQKSQKLAVLGFWKLNKENLLLTQKQ